MSIDTERAKRDAKRAVTLSETGIIASITALIVAGAGLAIALLAYFK